MIKNIDLAYAAGYADGDGCFHIGKEIIKTCFKPKYKNDFIVTSVNKNILVWLKEHFGGSIASPNNLNKNHKNLHYYHLKKRLSLPFVLKLKPFLVEKKQEAQLFIKFGESEDNIERDLLINEMKNLKEFSNPSCDL